MAFCIKRKMLSITLSAAVVSSLILSSGVAAAQAANVAKQSNEVTVIINGVKQKFEQPAVSVDGRTLVPLRGIFEALDAKVEWDNATHTATGTKGNIEVVVQIGNNTAYVNGKAVKLDVPAQTINGRTMVPLRFISESLGAEVKWDAPTTTATIISAGQVSNGGTGQVDTGSQVVQGVKVQYGSHNYGIKNQADYDKVMSILKDKVKDLDNVPLEGGRFEAQYHKYLDGDRRENYQEGSMDYMGLSKAEKIFKPYFDSGLSKDDAVTLYRLGKVATGILNDAKIVHGSVSLSDLILNGKYDCDPEGYLYSALLDMYGFNTSVLVGNNHAFAIVKIGSEWKAVAGVQLNPFDLSSYMSSANGFRILHQPTLGGTLR